MSLPHNSNDDASSYAISGVGDSTFHCASDHQNNTANNTVSHTSKRHRTQTTNDDESNNNELHCANKSNNNEQRAASSEASSPAAAPKKAKNNHDSNENQNNNQHHHQHHQQTSHTTNENPGSGGAAENNKHIPNKVDNVDDAIARMKFLLKVDELISGTDDPAEKKYYHNIEVILEQHLREEFDKGTYHINNLEKLTYACGRGIYALWISSSIPLKIGMSAVNKRKRAGQQTYKEAFDIASEEKVKEMCPDNSTVVNAIKNVMPPSLNFFHEKEDARTLLIQLQIVELMIASCHETSTGTAGERFMWWPSKEIQQFTTLLSTDDFSAEDIAFFDGVDKKDIDNIFRFLFTWSTYKSNIFSRRKGGDKSLLRLLPDEPADEFVQKHTTIRVFGLSRVPEHTDAVVDSLRLVQMQCIRDELKPLLEKAKIEMETGSIAAETSHAIQSILGRINNESDDYKHYKAHSDQRVAKGAVEKLSGIIDKVGSGQIIGWERCMYDAARNHQKDALNKLIPPEHSECVEILKGTNKLLRITTTFPSGKVVKHLIVRSFHPVFSEEKSVAVRTSTIDAIIATISYLSVSGIVTREYAEREARVMRAFMMEYEGYKGNIMDGEAGGSFRAARLHAVGKGLCVGGSPVNVKSVSTVLRIGYLETLDLYSSLGDELFGLLLCAFGISNGINNPINETFVCPGAEAIGALPAKPCPYNDDDRHVFVAGIRMKDFALAPCFACDGCATARYTREKEAIGQRIASGDVSVSDAQRERYMRDRLTNLRHVTKLKQQAENGTILSSDNQKLVDERKQINAIRRQQDRAKKSRQVTELKRKAVRGAEISSEDQKLVDEHNGQKNERQRKRRRQQAEQKAQANHKKCAQPTVDAILNCKIKSPSFNSLAKLMQSNHYTVAQSYNANFQKDIRDQVSAALIISNKPAKRTWRCDVCFQDGFEDYNEAVAHEKACEKGNKN